MILQRICGENKTYGVLYRGSQPLCVTLEREWIDNKPNISCIPTGKYEVIRHKSNSKNKQLDYETFKILDVPDRTDILIHIGNYVEDSKGCVLVGTYFAKDMICQSTTAMKKLLQELPNEFTLTIKGEVK